MVRLYLPKYVGEMLRRRVKLNSIIGSTEMGILLPMRPVDEANWSYFEWAPNFNIHMDPVSDNFYELVLRRGDHHREVNGIFHTFPILLKYRSKDLHVRHPTKKHLWKYSDRSDDYKDLIEALYRNDHKKDLECPDEGSLANILTFIRQAVHNQLDNRTVHDADDLYKAGFDSLQTVFLANTLSSAITSKHPDWSLSIDM